jgi:sulfopyruvate decarboxylase TPP-binding subunit
MQLEKARTIVEALKEAGVDFAVGLPDSQFHEVYKLIEEDPKIAYVGVTNEGEGAAVAMGTWFGGKKPVLVIATSGLLVATFSLARLWLKGVPILLLIPYRGDVGDPRWMGLYKKITEPILKVLDIPCRVIEDPNKVRQGIQDAQACASAWVTSVAVLITGEALW